MSQRRNDEIITCAECKRPFTWSYNEQRHYREQGWVAPKRCYECRRARKTQRLGSPVTTMPRQTAGNGMKPVGKKRPFPQPASPVLSWWKNPFSRYRLLFIMPAIIATLIAVVVYHFDFMASWIISISFLTTLAYGYDKFLSHLQSTWQRVPERVLNDCTLIGGTVGAIFGAAIFRHKTQKTTFQLQFALRVVIQIIVIALYWLIFKSNLLAGG